METLIKDILAALNQTDLTEKQLLEKFWQYEREQIVKALSYLAGVEEKIIWTSRKTITLK